MSHLVRDLRIAFLNLLRLPHYTVPTLLVLALGLGATAAVMGTLRTLFFTDPPYRDPKAIHHLHWVDRKGEGARYPASWPLYQEVKAQLKGVRAVEGMSRVEMNLVGEGDPEMLTVGRITPGFFSGIFQVKPLLGSVSWEEGTTRGIVLTEGLWRSRYGSDPAILGRPLTLGGESHPVVGVLPDAVRLEGAKAFIPLRTTPEQERGRYALFLPLYIRRAPEVSEAQLRAELGQISAAMAAEHPGQLEASIQLATRPWLAGQRESYRDLARILGLATGLLVLITLVNVANAILSRAVARAQDTALRLALGAGRWAAVRPRLLEAGLLAFGGWVIGVGVAQATLVLLRPMVGTSFQALRALSVDISLLVWMAVAALGVALVMGGLPGLLLNRLHLGCIIQGTGKGLVSGRSRRFRVAMAVVQVSLALTLVASFASLGGVLLRLVKTPLGIRTKDVAVFTCDTSTKTPEDGQRADAQAQALLARLRSLPGVEKAGSIAMLPVEDYGWNFASATRQRPMKQGEMVEQRTASPGLFEAFGIRLLAGRDFTEADMTSGEPIAVISQSMARTMWEGQDPLGQDFSNMGRWTRVVGVVSDVRNAGPANDAHQMTAYAPSPTGMATTTFVVRFQDEHKVDLAAMRKAAREVTPQWPIKGLRRMEEVVGESLKDQRAQLALLGYAGGLALLLSLAGLYNLLSFLVAQRTAELGLRSSLGATPSQILLLVLKSGLWMGGTGIALGLLSAFAAGRFLQAWMADAAPTGIASLILAASVLLTGTVLSTLLPALRAARMNPAEALRSE